MLIERIAAFIRGESDESFDELALAVFHFQYERNATLRQLCDASGASPAVVSDWRRVPTVPVTALEGPEPAGRNPDTDLQRTVIDHSFPAACLRGMGRPPVLSLIPTGEDPADGDLSSMADHLLRTWAAPDSSVAMAAGGVGVATARSFLGARQRDRRPTLVLATAASLARLLGALERRGLRFRLPPGSRVIETCGAAPEDPGLLARLADSLAVPAEGVAREHAIKGMTSRFYAGHNRRGELQPFRPPPWVGARVLDPDTLAKVPNGAAGVLAVFDLASPGWAAHLLAEDVAVAGDGGFHVTDRAATSGA